MLFDVIGKILYNLTKQKFISLTKTKMGDKKVKSHRKLIWSAFSALAFAIIMTSVLGTSFFDDLKTQVVGKKRSVNYMDPNDPKYQGVSYCKDSKSDAYGPICQKCYDSSGSELFEECWGTTDDDGDRDGGGSGGGYWEDGVWHEGYRDGGDYEGDGGGGGYYDGDGVWHEGSWEESGKQCTYYEQSQDGGGCKDCYKDGEYVGGECWNKNAKITEHDEEKSTEGRYTDEKNDYDRWDDDGDDYRDEDWDEDERDDRDDEDEDERDDGDDEDEDERDDGDDEDDRGDRQDWIDEGGYCVVDDSKTCETCYDADGNFGAKYCGDERGRDEKKNDDKRGNDKKGEDKRNEDHRGDDERGDDENRDDEQRDGDQNKADSKEVEKSLKDMAKNLDNFKDKEWDRLYKDFDRIKQRQDKFVERMKKMEEKDDLDFSDVKEKLKESQTILEDIKKEARAQQSAMSAMKKDIQAKLDAVDKSNITWDELNQLWSEVRKIEIYWPIRDGLDMRMRVEERYDGLLEMEKEIVRMNSEIEVDEEVAKKLEEVSKFLDDFDSYRKNAEDFYSEVLTMTDELVRFTGDSRDMDDMFRDMWDQMDSLREEFETFHEDIDTFMEDGWDTLDEGWSSGHDKMFYEDMENEIAGLKETLKLVVELEELLKDSENERVSEAVKGLKKLVDKASDVLTGLQERLEEGEVEPEVFDKAWGVMDGIGQSADKYMKVLEKNYDSLPKEAQEIMDMLEDEDDKGPRGGKEHKEKFRDVYGGIDEDEIDIDALVEKIRDDVIEEVMRMVSQELMTQLAPYLGEEAVSEIVNNLGAFGDDGEALLASSTEVYDTIAEVDEGALTENLKRLAKQTEGTLVVASLRDSFKTKWAEAAEAAEAGDKERMKTLEGEIEELLADNFDRSIAGEEAYQYKDVLAGKGLWYYSYVLGATKDGRVSGFKDKNGKATGEFRPENNVTQGEALKMVLNSCGVDMASYPPPTPWMPTDHWTVKEGYLQMAVEVGIDEFLDLKDPNKAATREDVAVMFAQACALDTDEDQTAFSDYTGKFGGHVQATYNAGIFTGQGDTGRFDGAKNINRAAMAKAMDVAAGFARNDSVLSDLEDFEEVLGGEVRMPTPTPSDEE